MKPQGVLAPGGLAQVLLVCEGSEPSKQGWEESRTGVSLRHPVTPLPCIYSAGISIRRAGG